MTELYLNKQESVMENLILRDIQNILNGGEKHPCNNPHYLKRLIGLLEKGINREDWLETAQYHNSKTYPLPPTNDIAPEVNQIIRLGGGYIIQVLETKYQWENCVFDSIPEVMNCIWETENKYIEDCE